MVTTQKPISFEELGREIDRKTAAVSNVELWIANNSDKPLSEIMSIKINHANWADGTLFLQAAIVEVIEERAAEIFENAFARMKEDARKAREELAKSFGVGYRQGETRNAESKSGPATGNAATTPNVSTSAGKSAPNKPSAIPKI